MADVQPVLKDMETRMQAAVDALVREFATVRTGRASANLLDVIRVDYYGTPTAVNQMASVTSWIQKLPRMDNSRMSELRRNVQKTRK